MRPIRAKNDINLKPSDHSPEAFFVPCADIESICRRLEVANDVFYGTVNTSAKLLPFSHNTSLTDGRQVNFPGTEIVGDVISGVEGTGSKLYLWAEFHDYITCHFGAMHAFTDG